MVESEWGFEASKLQTIKEIRLCIKYRKSNYE